MSALRATSIASRVNPLIYHTPTSSVFRTPSTIVSSWNFFSTTASCQLFRPTALNSPNRIRDSDVSVFGGSGHHGAGVPSYFQRQRLPANTIIRQVFYLGINYQTWTANADVGLSHNNRHGSWRGWGSFTGSWNLG